MFVEICKIQSEDWKRVLKVRKELLHGYGGLDNLIVDGHNFVPLLQKALLSGILDLIDIPEERRGGLMRDPLMLQHKALAKVHISIWDLSIEEVLSGEKEIRPIIISTEANLSEVDDGMIGETGNITVKIPGHDGSYRGKEIEVFLGKDPEDNKASLRLNTI